MAGTATVLGQLGGVTDVYVFGGAQSALYRRLLAERTGLPVCAGPVEATRSATPWFRDLLGVYDDLADARSHLADPWVGASLSIDAIDRLQRIGARVQSEGRVKVVELAVAFDVSEMTIRRDLDLLAEQGVVQRIRGAHRHRAAAVRRAVQPPRPGQGPDRVQAGAPLVGDGGIGIDASTTSSACPCTWVTCGTSPS